MSIEDYIEVKTKLSNNSASAFKWLKNKFGITVIQEHGGISGVCVYYGKTIGYHRKTWHQAAMCIAGDILQTIAEKNNYHFDIPINDTDINLHFGGVTLVTTGDYTVNDVYKSDKSRYVFSQILEHALANHLGIYSSPEIKIKFGAREDKFVERCYKDINNGAQVIQYEGMVLYFCFTDTFMKPHNLPNMRLIPFNIYDFIEAMIALGRTPSPNLLEVRNRDLALGYCYEYIDAGVD